MSSLAMMANEQPHKGCGTRRIFPVSASYRAVCSFDSDHGITSRLFFLGMCRLDHRSKRSNVFLLVRKRSEVASVHQVLEKILEGRWAAIHPFGQDSTAANSQSHTQPNQPNREPNQQTNQPIVKTALQQTNQPTVTNQPTNQHNTTQHTASMSTMSTHPC